ncbi:uncharacterized protein BYT42DRAFT_615459 [Radiomyces spectabilis]|uniref:uncharacterized protein n=1 Tax=Radiomyces spectabilis TaxID=64574 RepID=UPI00221FA973|nr:uncharacterized protein BYT42DRAFT_615459 [Radiomyces spectabilis]KAI8374286.1 hypothetical protein BYT42DRAFT_615459 [Radiomyces spectabilis]
MTMSIEDNVDLTICMTRMTRMTRERTAFDLKLLQTTLKYFCHHHGSRQEASTLVQEAYQEFKSLVPEYHEASFQSQGYSTPYPKPRKNITPPHNKDIF